MFGDNQQAFLKKALKMQRGKEEGRKNGNPRKYIICHKKLKTRYYIEPKPQANKPKKRIEDICKHMMTKS